LNDNRYNEYQSYNVKSVH